MPKKNKDFKTLQKEWYQKLKDKGFVDIEYNYDGQNFLTPEDLRAHKIPMHIIEAKAAYFQMAERFLNEHNFESNAEKAIWEYHANGLSAPEIVKVLSKVRTKKIYTRDITLDILKRLKHQMKSRYLLGYNDET